MTGLTRVASLVFPALWFVDFTQLSRQISVTPFRKELAEAHRTNKPCGQCSFYLLISKTFVEAGKNNPKRRWSHQEKEELMFANAEEEFFYEVIFLFSFICIDVSKDFLDNGQHVLLSMHVRALGVRPLFPVASGW